MVTFQDRPRPIATTGCTRATWTASSHAPGLHPSASWSCTGAARAGTAGSAPRAPRVTGIPPRVTVLSRASEAYQGARASDSHLDLIRAPYVSYGVKYIDLVSPAPISGPATKDYRYLHLHRAWITHWAVYVAWVRCVGGIPLEHRLAAHPSSIYLACFPDLWHSDVQRGSVQF